MIDVPDVHCHLDQVDSPERAVDEALAAGVRPIVAVGMHRTSSERCLRLRARYPKDVLVGVGLHPSEVPSRDDATVAAELAFVREALPDADVLGEVGLDYKDAPDALQQARQRRALLQQLEWAESARKPVNAHCRRAEREIVEVAAAFVRRTGLGWNLHWFTHSNKMARACATHGIFISPGPSILHSALQADVAAHIEPALLLLETDSPVVYAQDPARPAWARRVAEHLATLRGEPTDALGALLQANLQRYLTGALATRRAGPVPPSEPPESPSQA